MLSDQFEVMQVSTPERNCIGWPEQNCIMAGLAGHGVGFAARMADVLGRASGQAPKPRSGAPWARGSTARARTELSSGSRDARLFMVGSERRLAMARQFSGGSSDDGSCRERFERRLLWASR